MKKKEKKKLKKKDKLRMSAAANENQAGSWDLEQRIKQLEAKLKLSERTIEALHRQLKENKSQKNKKKPGKGGSKVLLGQQPARVAVAQRIAWKRHGYLRERYEFHLDNGLDKDNARSLADKDLREEFGEDAGYSGEELEQILS